MPRGYCRLAVVALTLLFAALLVPSMPTFGQAETSQPTFERIDVPATDLATEAATAAPAAANPAQVVLASAFLPLIRKAPAVTEIQFASQIDSAGNPVNPRTTFAYGILDLYGAVTIDGGGGSTYLLRWTLRGKVEPKLDSTGTISSASSSRRLITGFCKTTINCSVGKQPIDRGSYLLQVYLNGELRVQGTAVIQ